MPDDWDDLNRGLRDLEARKGDIRTQIAVETAVIEQAVNAANARVEEWEFALERSKSYNRDGLSAVVVSLRRIDKRGAMEGAILVDFLRNGSMLVTSPERNGGYIALGEWFLDEWEQELKDLLRANIEKMRKAQTPDLY